MQERRSLPVSLGLWTERRARVTTNPRAGYKPLLSKLRRNHRNWTGQAIDSTCPTYQTGRFQNRVGGIEQMLSKLRMDQNESHLAAKRAQRPAWPPFQALHPGAEAQPPAFCCPNWFFEKPNLDRSG